MWWNIELENYDKELPINMLIKHNKINTTDEINKELKLKTRKFIDYRYRFFFVYVNVTQNNYRMIQQNWTKKRLNKNQTIKVPLVTSETGPSDQKINATTTRTSCTGPINLPLKGDILRGGRGLVSAQSPFCNRKQ